MLLAASWYLGSLVTGSPPHRGETRRPTGNWEKGGAPSKARRSGLRLSPLRTQTGQLLSQER